MTIQTAKIRRVVVLPTKRGKQPKLWVQVEHRMPPKHPDAGKTCLSCGAKVADDGTLPCGH